MPNVRLVRHVEFCKVAHLIQHTILRIFPLNRFSSMAEEFVLRQADAVRDYMPCELVQIFETECFENVSLLLHIIANVSINLK